MLAMLFRPFGFIVPKTFKLFGFPIFRFWTQLMKVIPETPPNSLYAVNPVSRGHILDKKSDLIRQVTS
jgi:hypothetical protein